MNARPQFKAASMSRDRAALNPGGCDCHDCGQIFVGEEWHTQCGECFSIRPHVCKFCGAPSRYEASEQLAPIDFCHDEDHGA